MALRDKEDDSLLLSRSGRMSFKDRGGEHCVASARAAANETRKMITVPRIYEYLLQGTINSRLNYTGTLCKGHLGDRRKCPL